ncbi:PIN domain-containing protein [Nocardia sp. NPDC050717]|uniref:PIN domain-containing protein n=1 Tax=Nocardia sp. NPDC050717 TaxID=3157221 RepID=UPI0033E2965B
MSVQRPLLVIDTNMVFTDRALRSPHWRALALAVAADEVEVVFPEVVVRETARHMSDDAKTSRKELERAVKLIEENLAAAVLMDEWPVLSHLPEIRKLRATEELSQDRARERFRDQLADKGFGVAPVPSPPHDLIVEWSLRSHPPFDSTDKGYRDALIWWTFIEAAIADPHRCALFVSNDNDCLKKNEANPKPELDNQLSELGLTAVRFARNIDDALTIAQQARAEAAAEAMAPSRVRELLHQPMTDALLNLVGSAMETTTRDGGFEELVEEAGLIAGLESPTVSSIEVPELLFQYIRDGYSGSALIGSGRTVVLELGYEGFLYKADFYALHDDELDQVSMLDPDWNSHTMEVGGYLSVVAEFTFSIEPLEQRVLAVEITRLRAATDQDGPVALSSHG